MFAASEFFLSINGILKLKTVPFGLLRGHTRPGTRIQSSPPRPISRRCSLVRLRLGCWRSVGASARCTQNHPKKSRKTRNNRKTHTRFRSSPWRTNRTGHFIVRVCARGEQSSVFHRELWPDTEAIGFQDAEHHSASLCFQK